MEPLLDKNIFNLINTVRKYLPQSNIEMVTNGDPLNITRLKKLFSSGLNKILIREKRIDLYNDCLKFLKTRVELDLALFKDDIWSH